jgi:hypothetical protein
MREQQEKVPVGGRGGRPERDGDLVRGGGGGREGETEPAREDLARVAEQNMSVSAQKTKRAAHPMRPDERTKGVGHGVAFVRLHVWDQRRREDGSRHTRVAYHVDRIGFRADVERPGGEDEDEEGPEGERRSTPTRARRSFQVIVFSSQIPLMGCLISAPATRRARSFSRRSR